MPGTTTDIAGAAHRRGRALSSIPLLLAALAALSPMVGAQGQQRQFALETTAGSLLPNGTPSAMTDIELEGPRQWGKLVRASRNNRVQVFEADFGRGQKVITHVFWADPEGDSRGR